MTGLLGPAYSSDLPRRPVPATWDERLARLLCFNQLQCCIPSLVSPRQRKAGTASSHRAYEYHPSLGIVPSSSNLTRPYRPSSVLVVAPAMRRIRVYQLPQHGFCGAHSLQRSREWPAYANTHAVAFECAAQPESSAMDGLSDQTPASHQSPVPYPIVLAAALSMEDHDHLVSPAYRRIV